MLNLTTLLGKASGSDWLRYGRGGRVRSASERAPVVVWNCTRRCNLACRHCYSDSSPGRFPELSSDDAAALIADVAQMGCPALLFSGGEPLVRRDLLDLVAEARSRGLAVTLSTNGTLVTRPVAERLADLGVRYVGISLDGIGAVHDRFRGRSGAFERSLRGIRALREAGVRAGVRVTLSPPAIAAMPDLLDLVEREDVGRLCVYHLVPAGRGRAEGLPAPEAVRRTLDLLIDRARTWAEEGRDVEVLTVDNYADGPALWLRLEREDPERAAAVWEALSWNGGARNAAGRGLVSIDWEGRVRPDQFWPGPAIGSVRETPLSRIWSDPPEPLRALRERTDRVGGRCRSCRFLPLCGGGLASRALAATGDLYSPDPGCHLTDAEIAGPGPREERRASAVPAPLPARRVRRDSRRDERGER